MLQAPILCVKQQPVQVISDIRGIAYQLY